MLPMTRQMEIPANRQSKVLTLTTWNVSGVKCNLNFLRTCLSSCDILCLQEHWLFLDSLAFLDSVNTNYKSWGRSSFELNIDSISRRGKGGVAFLWKKGIDNSITMLTDLGNDRIIVLRVQLSKNQNIFIVNVYLPPSTEAVVIYQTYVDCLENIIEELQHEGFILLVVILMPI